MFYDAHGPARLSLCEVVGRASGPHTCVVHGVVRIMIPPVVASSTMVRTQATAVRYMRICFSVFLATVLAISQHLG